MKIGEEDSTFLVPDDDEDDSRWATRSRLSHPLFPLSFLQVESLLSEQFSSSNWSSQRNRRPPRLDIVRHHARCSATQHAAQQHSNSRKSKQISHEIPAIVSIIFCDRGRRKGRRQIGAISGHLSLFSPSHKILVATKARQRHCSVCFPAACAIAAVSLAGLGWKLEGRVDHLRKEEEGKGRGGKLTGCFRWKEGRREEARSSKWSSTFAE